MIDGKYIDCVCIRGQDQNIYNAQWTTNNRQAAGEPAIDQPQIYQTQQLILW